MAAGRYAQAGAAYRASFEATHNPLYLKKAGEAFLSLGSVGREEAIRSFRQYVQLARTLEEAQEGESLLRKAESLPPPAAAPPPPVPAPVPAPPPGAAPAPYPPQPYPPQPYPPAQQPYPPAQPAPVPPGAVPPGAVPPGAVPPGAAPPGAVAPGAPAANAPPAAPGANPFAPAAAAPVSAAPAADATGAGEPRSHWFGKKGSWVISAERLTLFGGYKTRVIQKDPTGGTETEVTYSGTDINFLGSSSGGYGSGELALIPRAPSVPRLAADYFVSPNISLGGFLGYTKHSTSEKTPAASRDQPDSSLLFIGARGGYYLPAGDALGIWFQGGLSYASASSTQPADPTQMGSTESSDTLSEIYVDAACVGVLPIVPHLAFTGTAFLDGTVSSTATIKAGGASQDLKAGEVAYGLGLGLLGYLGGE